jgi:hypothetical protein
MIPNSNPQNLGGINAIYLLRVADIFSVRTFKGNILLFTNQGISPTLVYHTYNSARVATSQLQGNNAFDTSISFKAPKDRPDLLDAALPFVSQKVVVLVEYTSGIKKVYGDPECPLTFSFNPTQQGTPQDFNGVNFYAYGIDFAPGRFGDISVIPIPEYIDVLTEDFDNWEASPNYPGQKPVGWDRVAGTWPDGYHKAKLDVHDSTWARFNEFAEYSPGLQSMAQLFKNFGAKYYGHTVVKFFCAPFELSLLSSFQLSIRYGGLLTKTIQITPGASEISFLVDEEKAFDRIILTCKSYTPFQADMDYLYIQSEFVK